MARPQRPHSDTRTRILAERISRPLGQTVVAENETAADLYFFKHGLDGYDRPTPKPEKPAEPLYRVVFDPDGRPRRLRRSGRF